MKAQNITFSEIVAHLVTVFADDAQITEYNAGNGAQYILLAGWAPNVINAPANRAAFLATFGQEQTEKAEAEARAILAQRAETFAASKYYANALEADAHEKQGQPAPVVGSFVWALDSGLKCENGAPDAINNLYWCDSNKDKITRDLVKVAAVYTCTAEEMTARDFAGDLVKNNMPFAGGCTSDDFDEIDWRNAEQKRTVYTIAAAVVDPSGRWYLIDSEGFDYSRYILLPLAARDMFADMYAAARERDEKQKAEERAQAEQERAARLAAYNAKAAKWSPLMRDLRALAETYRKTDYKQKKEMAAARRALAAGRRANIKAMAAHAFPGLRVSIRKKGSYNGVYLLTWEDGPTVEEMTSATAFELFAENERGAIGYDDCSTWEAVEFADFSKKYFCMDFGGVELQRTISDAQRETTRAKLAALVPGHDWDAWKWDNETQAEQTRAAIHAADMMPAGEYGRHIYNAGSPSAVLRLMCEAQSYYTAPTEPQKRPRSDKTAADGVTVHETAQTATAAIETVENDAPHISLALADFNGGVYVTGSTRATYCNRRSIKAHGATWNKTAQRWEGTTPEAIATLRAWFALRPGVA